MLQRAQYPLFEVSCIVHKYSLAFKFGFYDSLVGRPWLLLSLQDHLSVMLSSDRTAALIASLLKLLQY